MNERDTGEQAKKKIKEEERKKKFEKEKKIEKKIFFLKKNKDVRTSQSCDHVHLGTSAIQVNERDTGEQAKKKKIKNFF